MNTIRRAILAAAIIAAPSAMCAASAQDWHGDQPNWDPSHDYRGGDRYREHREMGPDDHVYRGHDGRYYCKRSNGTTGLIAGGAGGALIGHALGGGTLGTILGAGGGALLGRHLDKKHDEAQNRRNGYYCD